MLTKIREEKWKRDSKYIQRTFAPNQENVIDKGYEKGEREKERERERKKNRETEK